MNLIKNWNMSEGNLIELEFKANTILSKQQIEMNRLYKTDLTSSTNNHFNLTSLMSNMNSDNNNHNRYRENETMSPSVDLYLKILASIFYSISIVLGVGGNTLVLLVVIYYQRMRTVTNFFIFSMAVSDLIFALLCIPSTYIAAYLIQYWPFSSILCVFFNYMQNVSVTLTVYTLIWITLDKFWALVRPLKLRMTIKMCKYLICSTWAFSLFISLPIALNTQLIYFPIRTYTANTTTSTNNNQSISSSSSLSSLNVLDNNTNTIFEKQFPQCSEKWPDALANYTQIYNFFLLFIQYLLPLVILTFCYAEIGMVLRKTKAPGESIQNRDAKMLQSKKKMLKMCFFMVLTFMILWAPMQIITVYRFYDDKIVDLTYFGDLFFVCHLLAVSRSFLNPFIYAWTNVRFREGFKYFICFFYLMESKNPNYSHPELLRLNSVFHKNSLVGQNLKLERLMHDNLNRSARNSLIVNRPFRAMSNNSERAYLYRKSFAY